MSKDVSNMLLAMPMVGASISSQPDTSVIVGVQSITVKCLTLEMIPQKEK